MESVNLEKNDICNCFSKKWTVLKVLSNSSFVDTKMHVYMASIPDKAAPNRYRQYTFKQKSNFGQTWIRNRAGALVYWLKRKLIITRIWVGIPVLDTGWTYFTLICCKICFVCLKKTKNKRKRGPEDGPFLNNLNLQERTPPQKKGREKSWRE